MKSKTGTLMSKLMLLSSLLTLPLTAAQTSTYLEEQAYSTTLDHTWNSFYDAASYMVPLGGYTLRDLHDLVATKSTPPYLNTVEAFDVTNYVEAFLLPIDIATKPGEYLHSLYDHQATFYNELTHLKLQEALKHSRDLAMNHRDKTAGILQFLNWAFQDKSLINGMIGQLYTATNNLAALNLLSTAVLNPEQFDQVCQGVQRAPKNMEEATHSLFATVYFLSPARALLSYLMSADLGGVSAPTLELLGKTIKELSNPPTPLSPQFIESIKPSQAMEFLKKINYSTFKSLSGDLRGKLLVLIPASFLMEHLSQGYLAEALLTGTFSATITLPIVHFLTHYALSHVVGETMAYWTALGLMASAGISVGYFYPVVTLLSIHALSGLYHAGYELFIAPAKSNSEAL